MRYLLVEPRISRTWGKKNQFVGLLKLGNWLQSTGHEVAYVRFPNTPPWQPDEIFVTSLFTYNYEQVWDAVASYKFLYPNSKVTLGGIYATLCPEHAKGSGADEIFVGQHPEAKCYPTDPRLLPEEAKFAYIFTSEGCNHACTFCAARLIHGPGIKQYEVAWVMDEIRFLHSIGIREIHLGDDNLLFNHEGHIDLICEEIIKSGLKMEFKVTGGMVAKDFSRETAHLMKRAGFSIVSFGFESSSSLIRRTAGRADNTDNDEFARAIGYAKEAKFNLDGINAFFIIGLPYQTLDDMLDTLIFLLGFGVWAYPQRLTPIPHTVDWKRMKLEDWDLAKLHYMDFVAPDQDNFTHEDLKAMTRVARCFNVGRRMSKFDLFDGSDGRVVSLFKKKLITALG